MSRATRTRALGCALLALALPGCAGAPAPAPEGGPAAGPVAGPADAPAPRRTFVADSALRPAIGQARDALRAAGAAGVGFAVAVMRDGEPLWLEGIGTTAPTPGSAPIDPRTTRFRIYSVAKPMTAVAAARLAAQGVLDPNAPVRRHVPDFAAADSITAMQLATHTSGIRHYASEAEAASSRHCERVGDALPIFEGDPLVHEPGAGQSYSSWGFVLLSAVVEAAAGEPFPEAMRTLVFEPAGMRHTALDDPREPTADLAAPLAVDEDGRVRPARATDNTCKWGAGGFAASAEDVARFGAAMLDGTLLSGRGLSLFLRGSDDYEARGTGPGGTAVLWIEAPGRLAVALVANASGEPVDQALSKALAALRSAPPATPDAAGPGN